MTAKPRRKRGHPPREHPTVKFSLAIDARLLKLLRRQARRLSRGTRPHVVSLIADSLGVDLEDYGHKV